jgi:hypothetical protein
MFVKQEAQLVNCNSRDRIQQPHKTPARHPPADAGYNQFSPVLGCTEPLRSRGGVVQNTVLWYCGAVLWSSVERFW